MLVVFTVDSRVSAMTHERKLLLYDKHLTIPFLLLCMSNMITVPENVQLKGTKKIVHREYRNHYVTTDEGTTDLSH